VTVQSEPRVIVELSANQARLVRDLVYAVSWDDTKNVIADETEDLAAELQDALSDAGLDDFHYAFDGEANTGELAVSGA
jgi:hypothetical protein